ncbi:TPA: pesticin C-terminus-like muramidase [Escherichia coli]|nr:pesticin C-terminus-like muramidase [Escherichia coli]
MWHGGIHITDATIPWCALSTDSEPEKEYCRELYKGEQFIRCMADGEIVAWRVCRDYESAAIEWRGEKLFASTSFVLVKHYIQPADNAESGLTFFTLYMNLAPWAAYGQQGRQADRKVAGIQRYYTSAEDMQAGREAGKLNKDTLVTLSDAIVTRSRDRRQFTEVTITRETKNAAGETLAAGTKVWTVSDRGSLRAIKSAPVPSWWAKCTPAYTTQPEGVVNCTSRTDWGYYLSWEDVLHNNRAGELTAGFPLSYEPGNTAQQVIRPGRSPGDAARTFSLVTLGRDKDTLKKGDRVWVVSDGDSLTPVAPAASGSEPVFNDVYVPPVPVTVSAGDNLGHMGFYQLPEENGKRSRYQVHIECLSMDDMEKFITNPGKAGEDAPVYLTWQTDAPLFDKGEQGMVAGNRKTRASGILTLAKVLGVDTGGNTLTSNQDAVYYQIRPEGGWLPAASVKKVSQYALDELGFVTLNKAPASFDLIDGVKRPDNVVKGILEQLYKAAKEEKRITHALNKYNYQRLLEMTDSNEDGHYSEQEYLQAIHNVSYRDRLYRIIAKHASEWYYGKDEPLWKNYLDPLTRDVPLWKTYLEAFLDKMTWMKAVSEKGVALGPEPWHMHPIVFLEAVAEKYGDTIDFNTTLGVYRISKKSAEFILSWEAYVSTPYVPDGDQSSGVTVGYGYDLGQQTTSSARELLSAYYSNAQVERLLTAIGKKGDNARAIVHGLVDITITKDKALDMAMVLKQKYCQKVVDIYPQAINLPPDSAGAMLSLIYNRGASLALPKPNDPIDSRREMREIRDDFAQGNEIKIPSRLRSMKRLWSNQRGLIRRREGEAQLIENDLGKDD